ncbi:MAG: hypothetical protein FWD49_04925 [Firmicutes bacterium]|nr:hypothetical protein [Bacillota bacterium]
MNDFNSFLNEQLKDPEFKAEYESFIAKALSRLKRKYNNETELAMQEGKQLAQDIIAGDKQGYTNIDDMLNDLNV